MADMALVCLVATGSRDLPVVGQGKNSAGSRTPTFPKIPYIKDLIIMMTDSKSSQWRK